MQKLRVLYFGTWGYGKAGLEALLSSEHVQILKIFTKWNPEINNPYLNQVFEVASKTGITIINTSDEKLSKTEFESSVLNSGEADIILSCCYDRFFSNAILSYPKIAALNIHPSILPKYRGVKPLENALVNDEKEIGVTLHLLTDVVDAGDIVLQKRDLIDPKQTFRELYDLQCSRIKELTREFFEDPVKYIDSRTKQNESEKSFAPRLPFEIKDSDSVNDIISKAREYKII